MRHQRLTQAQIQRQRRRQRHEQAFLFTPTGQWLGTIARVPWEMAVRESGGDVVRAALACGLQDIPPGTKALWGRSAEEAWATYRRWRTHRQRA